MKKQEYNELAGKVVGLITETIERQKKADEEFFRSFLLDVVVRHSQGVQFDLEREFTEKFRKV